MPNEHDIQLFEAYITTVWQLAITIDNPYVWRSVADAFKRSMYYFNYRVVPKAGDHCFIHDLHTLRMIAREHCAILGASRLDNASPNLIIDGVEIPDFKL